MNEQLMSTCRIQRGFTMVEMLTVVVIVGILSALTVPMMGDTSQTKLIAAANQIAADIGYAQIESISHADDLRLMVFDIEKNTYYIASASEPAGINNPVGNVPYIISFGSGANKQLNGVTLSSISLNGDDRILFGVYGQLDQATAASITLACDGYQITLLVEPSTGEIAISDISDIPATPE